MDKIVLIRAAILELAQHIEETAHLPMLPTPPETVEECDDIWRSWIEHEVIELRALATEEETVCKMTSESVRNLVMANPDAMGWGVGDDLLDAADRWDEEIRSMDYTIAYWKRQAEMARELLDEEHKKCARLQAHLADIDKVIDSRRREI